jgi:hypothetical protein
MFCLPLRTGHVTAQHPPPPPPGGDLMNSALSCGQPLAASGDRELKMASQWPCVQHLCRIGYTDSELVFLKLLLKVKIDALRHIFCWKKMGVNKFKIPEVRIGFIKNF